jgi:hypothetical protein
VEEDDRLVDFLAGAAAAAVARASSISVVSLQPSHLIAFHQLSSRARTEKGQGARTERAKETRSRARRTPHPGRERLGVVSRIDAR